MFSGKKIKVILIAAVLLLTVLDAKSKPAFNDAQICKAALSSIMGVEIKDIDTKQKGNGITYMYYRLEDESRRYDYRCRLEGNRVIWGSAMGRWRTQKDDAVITFSVKNGKVIIKEKFDDEPESTETTFSLTQL